MCGCCPDICYFTIPFLLNPVGTHNLLITSRLASLAGVILLTSMGNSSEYWRFCLPSMILYIAGIGTVYFVSNMTVATTAKEEHQGTISGVYNVSHYYNLTLS